jgi:subtilisin family serine protease
MGSSFSQDFKAESFKLSKSLTAKHYLANTIIVKFRSVPLDNKTTNSTSVSLGDLGLLISTINPIIKTKTVNKQSLSTQQSIDEIGLNRIFEIHYQNNISIEAAINILLKNENVEYAEPHYIYSTFVEPTDPFYVNSNQYYLNNIKAPQAWAIQPNSNGVIIAIVDSGSDLEHEDLANNIYLNTSDPINGIDDDNDGYIDNYKGWDFVGLSASNLKEDNNPDVTSDSCEHGVHVSGLASAVTNNNRGIASLAQTARLMIVKVGADDNSSAIYRGYDGIIYAVNHGAKIINCSWGGPGGGAFGQDVIDYALSKNCLVVAAAGNSNSLEPIFPSAYKGVLAVANVNSSDIKSGSSSYGYHVGIASPGVSIYSTNNGDKYGIKSGTSMATPIVSSAVALVMAKFPTLTALQVGEILKLTSDDIYANGANSTYKDQLGKGRLNVFKALSYNNNLPAIKIQKTNILSQTFGSYAVGDTLSYFFDLKNILQNANNVNVTLSTTFSNVKILNNTINISTINTNETKTIGPFKVVVLANTPENFAVNFKLNYSNSPINYQDFEYFSTTLNQDYQNITVNKVYSTITSIGRVGYSGEDATKGLGFIYKDESLLYEASLMIGNSNTKVSNNARSNNGGYDNHFAKVQGVRKIENPNYAYLGESIFRDSLNANPLGIRIKNRMFAYKDAPNDQYIIAEYELTNTTNAAITNLFGGFYTDWDIDNSSKNVVEYQNGLQIAYTYQPNSILPYAGIKLLSTAFTPNFYPLSYEVANDFLADNNFTIAEKYLALSSGIKATTLGLPNGLDVSYAIGYGSFSLAPNETKKIAFAFLAGDNLPSLNQVALAAQGKYNQIITSVSNPETVNAFSVSQNYPNPANANSKLAIYLPKSGKVNITVYDILGKQQLIVFDGILKQGSHEVLIDSQNLQTGLYYYRTTFDGLEKVMKMVVIK